MVAEVFSSDSIPFSCKAIVLSNILLEKVKDLSFCIDRSPSIPILQNVRLRIGGGFITLIASDLVNTAKANIQAETHENADICVPFELLFKHLATLENENLTLIIDNDHIKLTVYTSHGIYELPLQGSETWPKLNNSIAKASIEVEIGKLASAFQDVLPFVSIENLVNIIQGININIIPMELIVSASNRETICIRKIFSEKPFLPLNSNSHSVTISPKIAKAFSSFARNDSKAIVNLELSESFLSFSELPNGVSITTQLMVGEYPNLIKYIPKINPNRIVVERSRLLASISRTLPFIDNDLKHLRIKLGSTVNLSLRADDSNNSRHAWENVDVIYEGEDLEIGISIVHLKNAITVWKSEKLIIELSSPSKPIIVRDFNFQNEDLVLIGLIAPNSGN